MLKFLDMGQIKEKKKVQVIILSQGKVLLLKLAKNRGGFWQNITGGVDKGEDFIEAAKREMLEETGFKTNVEYIPFDFKFKNQYGESVNEQVFVAKLEHLIDPVLSHEHETFKWVDLQTISEQDYKYKSNFEPVEWLKKK
jgi:8-oxo-dGTP pyrophosphatase MutT (NUDIX family)